MDYGTTAVCNNTTGQIANNTVTAQNYDHILIIKHKKKHSQLWSIHKLALYSELDFITRILVPRRNKKPSIILRYTGLPHGR